MDTIVIHTTPIDTQNDMDSAVEQLTDIAQGDLVVNRQRMDRRRRTGTLTVTTSRGDRFRERLAASPYARFYTVEAR